MEQGYIDEFDLERIISAVEEDLRLKPIEKPKVVVQNHSKEDPTAHIVNTEQLTCTCEDYDFNCEYEERQIGDNKYCKHIYFVVFKKLRMF